MLPWIKNLDGDVKTVIDALLDMQDMEEEPETTEGDFLGRLLSQGGSSRVEFNTIPPVGQPGKCKDILVVTCFKRSSYRCFNDALDHIQNRCPNTKHIIFVATKDWIKLWNKTFKNVFKDRVESFIFLERIGEGGLTKAI